MNTARKVDFEVKVMQHEYGVKTAEIQHVYVMQTTYEVMQHEEAENTAEEVMHHAKVMQTTNEDDDDDRMSEEQVRNGVGQARGPSLPAPSVRRSSKMPEDRRRFSSRREHSPKRASVERNGPFVGRLLSSLSKKSR